VKNRLIDVLGPHSGHPVYTALRQVMLHLAREIDFEYVSLVGLKRHCLFNFRTNAAYYTPFKPERNNIYLTNTNLSCLESWKLLAQNMPMVIVDEYFERGSRIDTLAKLFFRPFRGIPFVSLTKRTHRFHVSMGIGSILIPPAKKKIQGAKKRSYVLYLGRLVDSKNPMLFLELARQFRNEKFVMIGKGQLAEKVAAIAGELGNVKLIQFVEKSDDIYGHLANAKLLVQPAFRDPIGFVVVEALSAQTPVLASRGVGTSDYLPAEWIADPANKNEWVAKTQKILSNLEQNARLAETTFEKEHLNIEDPYFRQAAGKLQLALKSRWPHLTNH